MDDPRRDVAREYLGSEHRYAETMLSRMNAVDPMRQAPSHEAVEAFLDEWFKGEDWTRGMPVDAIVSRQKLTRAALGVFLTVMAGTEVRAEPPAENPEWTPEIAAHVLLMSRHIREEVYFGDADALNEFVASERRAFPITKPKPVWPPSERTIKPEPGW